MSFREMRETDVDFVAKVRASAAPFLHNPKVFSESEVLSWFKRQDEPVYWIVSFKNLPIGYFRFQRCAKDTWQIGADFHPDWIGRGLAVPAYSAFLRWANANFQVRLVSLRVLASNTRALHLYSKMGFSILEETEFDFEMQAEMGHLLQVTSSLLGTNERKG